MQDEELDGVASDDEDDEEDAEKKSSSRPYMALLQSFNDSNAPNAKRRKLGHTEKQPVEASPSGDEGSEDEGNDEDGSDEPRDPDHVDEVEDAGMDMEELPENDSEDEEDPTDPFDAHFANSDETAIARRVSAIKDNKWSTKRAMLKSWRATLTHPDCGDNYDIPTPLTSLNTLRLKQKLKETASKTMSQLTDVQQALGRPIFDYQDVLHCDRTVKNSEQLRKLVCLHAVNHVFKSVAAYLVS